MIGKMHDVTGKKIFASCDRSLLGKTISTPDFEITFSKSFYGTSSLSKKELLENLSLCSSANFFGEKVCGLLLESKIIQEEEILYIQKIPHIQIYKL